MIVRRAQLIQFVGEDNFVDGLQISSSILNIFIPVNLLHRIKLLMLLQILAIVLLESGALEDYRLSTLTELAVILVHFVELSEIQTIVLVGLLMGGEFLHWLWLFADWSALLLLLRKHIFILIQFKFLPRRTVFCHAKAGTIPILGSRARPPGRFAAIIRGQPGPPMVQIFLQFFSLFLVHGWRPRPSLVICLHICRPT